MARKSKQVNKIKGKKLSYNAGLQSKYEKSLRSLVARMAKEVNREVMKLFKSNLSDEFFDYQDELATMDASIASQARMLMNKLTDKYTYLFDSEAPDLSLKMVSSSDKASKVSLSQSLDGIIPDFTLKTNFLPAGVKEVSKSLIAENVSLITTIPDVYFKNITGAVMRSITTGTGVDGLMKHLKKYYGESDRKAKNVALDQTRKAYNSINKQRMMTAGFTSFEWLHSGGGLKPRKDHQAMSGKIYSFDNLPVIDKRTGEKGIPGQAINCRCTMKPVYVFPEGE